MKHMPSFLIIGPARAGTTALHVYLRQHPAVFMPFSKEPNFFAFEGDKPDCIGPGADYINNSLTDLDAYQAIFADASAGAICGEASPLYLYSDKAARRISHHIPDAHLIVILRNPIEQAYSHFLYATKQRIETIEDFTLALKTEAERLSAGWQPLFGYSRFPRYAEQLERYFALFARNQMFIRTYEDFLSGPEKLIAEIFAFIGADSSFRSDMARKPNAGGVPKSRLFQDFLMKPNPVTGAIATVTPKNLRLLVRDRLSELNLTKNREMPPEARHILRERLMPEIERLEVLIDRDLSAWRA